VYIWDNIKKKNYKKVHVRMCYFPAKNMENV